VYAWASCLPFDCCQVQNFSSDHQMMADWSSWVACDRAVVVAAVAVVVAAAVVVVVEVAVVAATAGTCGEVKEHVAAVVAVVVDGRKVEVDAVTLEVKG